jgi:hypothetical protein
MWKGLIEGSVAGFYITVLTGREKKLIGELNNFILVFINYQSPTFPKRWKQPPCMLPPGRTASSITPLSLPLIFGWLLCVGLPIGIAMSLSHLSYKL